MPPSYLFAMGRACIIAVFPGTSIAFNTPTTAFNQIKYSKTTCTDPFVIFRAHKGMAAVTITAIAFPQESAPSIAAPMQRHYQSILRHHPLVRDVFQMIDSGLNLLPYGLQSHHIQNTVYLSCCRQARKPNVFRMDISQRERRRWLPESTRYSPDGSIIFGLATRAVRSAR